MNEIDVHGHCPGNRTKSLDREHGDDRRWIFCRRPAIPPSRRHQTHRAATYLHPDDHDGRHTDNQHAVTSTPTNSGPATTSRATAKTHRYAEQHQDDHDTTPVRAADNQTTADNRTTSRHPRQPDNLPKRYCVAKRIRIEEPAERHAGRRQPGRSRRAQPGPRCHRPESPRIRCPYSGLNLPRIPGSPTGTRWKSHVNEFRRPHSMDPSGTSPVPTTASGGERRCRPLASAWMAPAARAGGSRRQEGTSSPRATYTTDNGSRQWVRCRWWHRPSSVTGRTGDDVADETRAGGETGSGPVGREHPCGATSQS